MENEQKSTDGPKPATAASRQSTSSKRASTIAPKPPLELRPSTIVAGNTQLVGIHPVTIGARSVVSPHARINSTYCAIEIGSGCILSEKCRIGLSDLSQDSENTPLPEAITIGDNVRIETNAVVEAASIGNFTIVDPGAQLGAGAVIGSYCHITAYCIVPSGAEIPDYTVLMVDGRRRMNSTLRSTPVVRDIQAKSHEKHLKVLERLIPDMRVKLQ